MSARHTQGRLQTFNTYATPEIRDQAGDFVAAMKDGGPRAVHDARRLVACWNACDGVDTETLVQYPAPFTELRAQRDELLRARQVLGAERIKLEAERDELLAALKAMDEAMCNAGNPHMSKEERTQGRMAIIAARAVIAKHQPTTTGQQPD